MSLPKYTYVCGRDEFLAGRQSRMLWREMTADIPADFGQEIISGDARNADEVEAAVTSFISAVLTVPMFGGRKAVWFKDITFLADSLTGQADATKKQTERLLECLERVNPEQTAVLLSASPADRRRKETKWLEANGRAFVLGEGKEQTRTVLRLIREEADRLGARLTAGAEEVLMAQVRGDARLAAEEVRKLAAYLGEENRALTEEDVMRLVPEFGEGDFFEAGEAFFSGDLNWALEAIRKHFFAGRDARPLLVSLQNRARLLIQLKALMQAGVLRGSRWDKKSLEKAAQNFSAAFAGVSDKSSFNVFTQNPWYLGRLGKTASQTSMQKLLGLEKSLFSVFEKLLGRAGEAEAVMRELAIAFFR